MTDSTPRPERRSDHRQATHRRIVEAAVALHQELGPTATTISAIADRAGVQRLTVYRHFPDQGALLQACSARWMADHPPPDPAQWAGIESPAERIRTGLQAVYPYYRSAAPMLGSVLHDAVRDPLVAETVRPLEEWQHEVAALLAGGWGVETDGQHRIRAAIGHTIRFETWQSLAAQGLPDQESAELMARLVEAAAR